MHPAQSTGDFNDDALALGVAYWVRLVERACPKT